MTNLLIWLIWQNCDLLLYQINNQTFQNAFPEALAGMNQFRFGSKAATLHDLQQNLTVGLLCPQLIVVRNRWGGEAERIADEVMSAFSGIPLAVRSSARGEDSADESLAGAYTSLLNVKPEQTSIKNAINQVFASYHHNHPQDEVLIQSMVRNVVISGVVLTRDLDTGSPYYVINYDSGSGRTDTVTSGGDSKTVLVHRARPDKLKSSRMRRLIDSVIEIESVTGSQELDIEFCINDSDDVYILQVRPLAARSNWIQVPDVVIDTAIDTIRNSIVSYAQPAPPLAGNRTIFSEMTDWNPAEMIGNAPKPLALSLYKSLITDSVWAKARARMGYQLVDGPLLYDFHGRPYIDVRKSFNSFLPSEIDKSDADTIVTHQLDLLAANPELHDKVEFSIAVTCQDFDTKKIDTRLLDAGLDSAARQVVSRQIHKLTKTLIDASESGLAPLIAQADTLLKTPAINTQESLQDAQRLLELCRADGTLPFSQLARHGFIGVQLLRSLATRDVFDSSHIDAFMHSLHTVATDLIQDMNEVHRGAKSVDIFMGRYGHLRPGTYDIMSWRYEERPDLYVGQGRARSLVEHPPFILSTRQRLDIQKLIEEAGFETSADALLEYIALAIKGREQSKFAFSRAISNALKIFSAWGEAHGIERDDMAYLPVSALRDEPDIGKLRAQIACAREAYVLTRALRLPHVIIDAHDIDIVRMPLGQPTFVTSKSVTAPGHVLTQMDGNAIGDRIVLIESADPGFDWIFSHRVLGLITKYGGANSHMAIRCAEFGLPAAIGCGERLFNTICKANTIELNAAARRIACH